MNADLFQKAVNMARFERARAEYLRLVSPILKRDPSDLTIGTGNFTQGIPAFWFARALDPGSMEKLYTPYAESAWVRRAIKNVAGPISSVDLVFSKPETDAAMRRHTGRGRKLYTARGIVCRDPDAEIELPQIRQFLRQPMRDLTYEDFVEASIGWYQLQECFWLLGDRVKVPFPEAKASPFEPLIVARPDRMRAVMEGGNISAWEFTDWSGKVWPLELDQVVRLFGWNPYNPHRGLGDYPSAAVAAESHWLGGKFKRQLTADNDTAPIISAKNGTPTDTQMDQIKMQLAERRANRMRGNSKTMFLPGEIDVHDPKILSVDAAFIAGQLEDRHEIFVAFGNPPSLADVKASYSIGQASDWFALIFNTCIPVGNKFCASMETLIKRLTGEDVEVGLDWDEHYVMQQVRSERTKDAQALWAMGMPMKEVSEHLRLNLPPYENDDIGYVPINVTPTQSREEIEAAAPTENDYSEGDQNNNASQDDNTEDPDVAKMMRVLRGPVVIRDSKREAIWKSHIRLRSKSVKLFQSKASRLFNEYRVTALRKLETATKGQKAIEKKSLIDVIFDPKLFGLDLFKALTPIEHATLQTAGDELNKEIGIDDPWTMAPQTAKDFIAGREEPLANVGNTARDQLNTALSEGLDKGETTAQLADRVRGVFNNLSKFEARRIAMTETSSAYGYARHQAMADAGIEFKEWLTSHGPNVRPAHAAAEGQVVALDEPFVVMGEELMYPGDPTGSAGNVINCQCIQIATIKKL